MKVSMTGLLGKYLILHGVIILLIGLLSGLIYWQTIIRNKRPEVIRGWRVAHMFLAIEGMFIIIVGLLIPHLALGDLALRLLAWIVISSGYGFT
jgi:cytochrome b subunit of formate dehydrogenase